MLADVTARFGLGPVVLTSITTYIDRDILVSRDASALTGSVGISFTGLGVDAEVARLNSNLVDTTDLQQWTQELRLGSNTDSPFQWVLGAFYTDIDRRYSQRLPTPGYDNPYGQQALNGLCLLAGLFCQSPGVPMTPTQAANGFPLNSPYNADLPYDIRQMAAFGEASYDFGQFRITAGARYYDFKETRDFISGGVFSNRDTRIADETSSDGFSPRVIVTYEPDDDFRINVQASKGFRVGGVNDPLNTPLCDGGVGGIDALTYGNRPTYEDETLWNYEAGVRYQGRTLSFNAAAFYTDISNLQVTADAGSCSSRVVFNVPQAHTMGVEAEISVSPAPGLDLSVAGSLIEAEFDSDVTIDRRRHHRGHARRQSPADGSRIPDCRDRPIYRAGERDGGMVRVRQLPARRQSLHPARRPGAHRRDVQLPLLRSEYGQFRRQRSEFRIAPAAGLRADEPRRRGGMGQRFRREAVRQQPVRRKCQALARSGTGRTGADRLQRQPAAHVRHHAAQALRRLIGIGTSA